MKYNWGTCSGWIDWIAVDSNGGIYGYIKKPTWNPVDGEWESDDSCWLIGRISSHVGSGGVPILLPEESLEERPKDK